MEAILQKTCNNASTNLHYLYNDFNPRKTYDFGVCTKKKSGSRIRARRIELKMTLKDVHQLIPEISISRLSNWEQGINMVSVDEAKKLAAVFKVPASYLLTLEDALVDDTERLLLERFRSTDMRGRKYILLAAQGEAQAEQTTERTVRVAERRKAQTLYFGPQDRRAKKDG